MAIRCGGNPVTSFPATLILTPTRLALATALGISRVSVYTRPRVALIATGDEVREMGDAIDGPWTICNNRFLLSWLVRIQGGCPVQLGVAKDDRSFPC